MQLPADSRYSRRVPFPATRWSMVIDCARQGTQSGVAEAAMTQLFHDYWPPLYTFARRRGCGPQEAQDHVQGFLVHLFATGAYASVDRTKGKFRSFLVVAFKNYLADDRDRRETVKRGAGQTWASLEAELPAIEARWAEHSPRRSALSEESAFEQQWALAVVTRALAALQASFAGGGKRERVFGVLKPFLTGGTVPPRAEAAAQLGISEEGLRTDLSRLRARYRECLRAEVARTVPPDADPDEEMSYLCRVLLAGT